MWKNARDRTPVWAPGLELSSDPSSGWWSLEGGRIKNVIPEHP